MPIPMDTSPDAERVIIEGYRTMSPTAKLEQVATLNRALDALATARLRAQYGRDMAPRELNLRLAARRLDAETMKKVFDWDPSTHCL